MARAYDEKARRRFDRAADAVAKPNGQAGLNSFPGAREETPETQAAGLDSSNHLC